MYPMHLPRLVVNTKRVPCPLHEKFEDDGEGKLRCETCGTPKDYENPTYLAHLYDNDLVVLNPAHILFMEDATEIRQGCLDEPPECVDILLPSFRKITVVGVLENVANQWEEALNGGPK